MKMVDQEKGFKAEQVLVAPAPAYLEDTGSQVLGTSKTQYESSRHLQMIAIGGGIGLGLFVGSGASLSNGGPATVLIDFAIVGVVSGQSPIGLEALS